MKVLIIRTDIEEASTSRGLGKEDAAVTFELYKKYNLNATSCYFHIKATNVWDKYTFIDERDETIDSFNTMAKLLNHVSFLGNVLVLTHEQWLDFHNPKWRTEYTRW